MAENRSKRVFIGPAGKEKSDDDTKGLNVNGYIMEKISVGMNSGDFEQTVKAYAMFDRISKGGLWKWKAA